jgi:hypothetical protein
LDPDHPSHPDHISIKFSGDYKMGNCCRKPLKDEFNDLVTIGETSNVVATVDDVINVVDEIIEEVVSELNKIPS